MKGNVHIATVLAALILPGVVSKDVAGADDLGLRSVETLLQEEGGKKRSTEVKKVELRANAASIQGTDKQRHGARKLSSARVLLVPEDYDSIQNAVNAANPGDTVSIGPGLYKEAIVIEQKDNLRLIGRKYVYTVVIDGFDLGNTHGIHVKNSWGVELINLVVQGFRKRIAPSPPFNLYRGVWLENSQECLIENNVFRDNGDGLWLQGSNRNKVISNIAEHNFHDGFFIRDGSSHNTVEQNMVLDNGPDGNRNDPPDSTPVPIGGGCGIQLTNEANANHISENLAARNARGLQIDRGSTQNILTSNRSYSSSVAGIIVQCFGDSPAPKGNTIIKNDAKFNTPYDLVETRDAGPCTNGDTLSAQNTWESNHFETANLAGDIPNTS